MSAIPPDLPDDIREAASAVRRLAALEKRTEREEADLNQARVKVAYYACRREGVPADWDNLSFILGSDAEAIAPAVRKAILARRAAAAAAEAAATRTRAERHAAAKKAAEDAARREAEEAGRKKRRDSGDAFWSASK